MKSQTKFLTTVLTIAVFSILSMISWAIIPSLDEKRRNYPNSIETEDQARQVTQLAESQAADASIVVGQTFAVQSPFGSQENIVFKKVDDRGKVDLADNSWLPGGVEATDAEHRLDESGINNRIARAHAQEGKTAPVDTRIINDAVALLEKQRGALGSDIADSAIAKLRELSQAGKVHMITNEDPSLPAFGHYSSGTSTSHQFGEQIHLTETVGDKAAVLVHEAVNAVTGVHQTAINFETGARLSRGNPIVLYEKMLGDETMSQYYAKQAEISREAGSTVIILAQDVSRARDDFRRLGLDVSDSNRVKIVNINNAQEIKAAFADVKQTGNLGKTIALVDDFAKQKIEASGITNIGTLVILGDNQWDLANSQMQLIRTAENFSRSNV